MGGVDSKMPNDKPMAVVNPMPTVSESNAQDEINQKANVTLHLFHYRQQIGLKSNHLVKWASAKLLLTEELLKQKQQELQPNLEMSLDELETDAEWAERQLALLTDDEDDLNDDNDDNAENRAPKSVPLDIELDRLMTYRLKLRSTILQVAQEKLRKREKIKVKRLKRRTLISSKKPSNKDKYR